MESSLRRALLIAPWLWALGCGSVKTDAPGVADASRSESVQLTVSDVQTIIAQAATEATRRGLPVTIAVVDHTGVQLGVLQMAGAKTTIRIQGGGPGDVGKRPFLDGRDINFIGAQEAAISKAGTGAFFSTQGNAFTTRTASFIVQEHFPPQVDPSPGGPLFGVQFSNLRFKDVNKDFVDPRDVNRGNGVYSAINSNLRLGLSADPGGLPLYKNGVAVGGIGVEGDGIYTLDQGQPDAKLTPLEEIIAAAGTAGFSAPAAIRGDNIWVGGFQFLFADAEPLAQGTPTPYETIKAAGRELTPLAAGQPSPFLPRNIGGTQGTVPQMFDKGFKAGTSPAQGGLTSEDVTGILSQAAAQAEQTRAAIRLPIGVPARVTIAVVDASGTILGIFRTLDAPIFGFDVSVQKARTAAFFSRAEAGSELMKANLGEYVAAAAADGLLLDGKVAFSTRAVGFLSQPIFPPGARPPYKPGPFSTTGTWSVFNTGLQLDLFLRAPDALPLGRPAVPGLGNGITIFPGGFPLYKNGVLVGAIGVSGDGVDQDDLIGVAGSAGFEAPPEMRSDTVVVRGVTLPYARFPRHPNL